MKFKKVIAEIVAIEGGKCSFGHQVGEKFIFETLYIGVVPTQEPCIKD